MKRALIDKETNNKQTDDIYLLSLYPLLTIYKSIKQNLNEVSKKMTKNVENPFSKNAI